MNKDIALRCKCGQLRARIDHISPDQVNRNVCCCASCQRYAQQLGRADEILDEHGGTDVFQISPVRLQFTAGEEQLACLQLTPKGALRWYASCCKTPIAHTLPSFRVPFVAINHLCVDRTALEGPLEAYVGPIRATVNGQLKGKLAKELKANGWSLFKMIIRYAPMMIGWIWRGEHKRSPFFDRATGKPVRPVLSLAAATTIEAASREDNQNKAAPLTPKKVGCG